MPPRMPPAMRTHLLALLLVACACGTARPDGASGDGAVPGTGGAVPGTVPARIRPVFLATADRPAPADAATLLDSTWQRVNARLVEEWGTGVELAPTRVSGTARTCAQLGPDARSILFAVRSELEALTLGGREKLQVLLPCADPTKTTAGIAFVGGDTAVVFDGDAQLSTPDGHAYVSTVAIHELGHTLGLLHNSVGENCMGAWERLDIAQQLFGSRSTARCVLLPYQRARASAVSDAWLRAVPSAGFTASGPPLLATPVVGQDAVQLTWDSQVPDAARGWHLERATDGGPWIRVRQIPRSDPTTTTDDDAPGEYHDDPAMDDPGLEHGRRYCYRVALHDGTGVDGVPGTEACVSL